MAQMLIYHGRCPDGFMAATIFRQAAGPRAGQIEFYPGVHQADPPDVAGKDVVFVDFSYKRAVILGMAGKARSIRIFDHHVSARTDLVDLPANVDTVFDLDRSGAGLAWDNFVAGQPRPTIVDYIEANDLGQRGAYPNLREVSAGLRSYDYDFDIWTRFLETDQEKLIARLEREGRPILRQRLKNVRELVETGRHELEIDGQVVPVVNSPHALATTIASRLAQGQPFAATYFIDGRWARFELASSPGGADVSQIAAKYGGGGHKHRAGFRLEYTVEDLATALKLAGNQSQPG